MSASAPWSRGAAGVSDGDDSASDLSSSSSGSLPPLLFTPRAGRQRSAVNGSAFFASLGANPRHAPSDNSTLAVSRSPAHPGVPSLTQSVPRDMAEPYLPASLWYKFMVPSSSSRRSHGSQSVLKPPENNLRAATDRESTTRYDYNYTPSYRTLPRTKDKGKGKAIPFMACGSEGQKYPQTMPRELPSRRGDPLGTPSSPSSSICLAQQLWVLLSLWIVSTTFLYLWNRHLFAASSLEQVNSTALMVPAQPTSLIHLQHMHRKLAFPPFLVSALQAGTASIVAMLVSLAVLPFVKAVPRLGPLSSFPPPKASVWLAAILVLAFLYAAETAFFAKGVLHAHPISVGLGRLPAGVTVLLLDRWWGRSSSPEGMRAVFLAFAGTVLLVGSLHGTWDMGMRQVYLDGTYSVMILLSSVAGGTRWRVAQLSLLRPSSPLKANTTKMTHQRVYPLVSIACIALLVALGLCMACRIGEPEDVRVRTWRLLTGQWGQHGPPKRLPSIPDWSAWVPDTTTWAWIVLALVPGCLEVCAWSSELSILKLVPLNTMVALDLLRTGLQLAAVKALSDEEDPPSPSERFPAFFRTAQGALGLVLLVSVLVDPFRTHLLDQGTTSERARLLEGPKLVSFGTFSNEQGHDAPDPITCHLALPGSSGLSATDCSAHEQKRVRSLAQDITLLDWDGCGTVTYGDGLFDQESD